MTSLEIERKLISQGYRFVGGVDEVGRGSLAGPVAAGFVIFPSDVNDSLLSSVTDSKKLTARKREHLSKTIKSESLCAEVGWASVAEIDDVGIVLATKLAMTRAIEKSLIQPDYLLVDAVKLDECLVPYESIVKGDLFSRTIAAASIIAKVTRDFHMSSLSMEYPGYFFEKNKGYGTRDHMTAIRSKWPTDIHRVSFEPVASMKR